MAVFNKQNVHNAETQTRQQEVDGEKQQDAEDLHKVKNISTVVRHIILAYNSVDGNTLLIIRS